MLYLKLIRPVIEEDLYDEKVRQIVGMEMKMDSRLDLHLKLPRVTAYLTPQPSPLGQICMRAMSKIS